MRSRAASYSAVGRVRDPRLVSPTSQSSKTRSTTLLGMHPSLVVGPEFTFTGRSQLTFFGSNRNLKSNKLAKKYRFMKYNN